MSEHKGSTHPYLSLPERAYWKTAVGNVSAFNIESIYRPKFKIDRTVPIAAAGSCFAQHISRNLKNRGYSFLDYEPPLPFLDDFQQQRFGLNLYSARYGNIYSVGQLYQLVQRAFGHFEPEETVWENNGRFYDPFRPAIEPEGFASRDELEADVKHHLHSVKRLVTDARLFIFTFGLTETWINTNDGSILPTCPGTVAGTFDPERYRFHNSSYSDVLRHARKFIAFVKKRNPDAKFLFTVSPVPLTATASGNHVLPATIYSKSVLRAVCGELYECNDDVDYFPSYEIISSYPYRGMFFEPNMRSVTIDGVNYAMNQFFEAHADESLISSSPITKKSASNEQDNVVCEEEILETFGY